jgi:hypothetical protein
MSRARLRIAMLLGLTLSGCSTVAQRDGVRSAGDDHLDSLYAQFRDPPVSARPWAWWHWMNGNVDAAEAEADLDWLAQAGVGGVFQFEGGLGAPQQVKTLQPFMAPGWQDALRRSVARAHRNGMQIGIATSPGWSATGGPWVKPVDAMKKLVWSEIDARAGKRAGPLRLPLPPQVSGPYQDVGGSEARPGERYYADVAVVAFPRVDAMRRPVRIGGAADPAGVLADDRYAQGLALVGDKAGTAHVTYDLGEARVVRSVRLGLPGPRGFGAPQPPIAALEASDDGVNWRPVATLPATTSPVRTASFAAQRARYFRLAVMPDPQPGFTDQLVYAPGANRIPFPRPDGRYQLTELTLWGNALVNAAEEKAGFAAAPDYHAVDTPADAGGIAIADIRDLSGRLRADGTLDWTPPDARTWTILRFGTTLTGHHNGPAPEEATGLEVDKLSAPRVEAYLRHYLGLYESALHGGQPVDALLSDSIEAGPQNWTDDMVAQFAQRQGYDLVRWLPALAGRVVSDGARTDAFLSDFRGTIADLVAQAHYGTIARIAREKGLAYTAEALEDHRPQLGDDLAMRAVADVPSGAMWWFPRGGTSKATYEADVKGAASVAHVLGKPVTAVEALTAFGQPWSLTPDDMRPAADFALVLGGNRLMLHSSVHQAAGGAVFPGTTMLPLLGHYFNRNEAWAGMAQPWTAYLARSQFLLRQGRAETPIALFVGEEAPVTGLYGDAMPRDMPAGMDYDFVDTGLLDALTVRDGVLRNRSGNGYALLYLGGSSARMTMATLERIAALARQGIAIGGPKPTGSPRLRDDPAAFAQLVDSVWALPNVHEASTPAQAARLAGVRAQWRLSGVGADRIAIQHRVAGEDHVYFVVNRADRAFDGTLSIAAAGQDQMQRQEQGQWWDADTVERAPAISTADGIVVHLAPNESRFLVVSPKARALPSYGLPVPVAAAESGWKLRLESRGRPDVATTLDALGRLDLSHDPALRDFSGVAHYTGALRFEAAVGTCRGARYWLDLGDMADVARVSLRGSVVGTVWTTPHRIEVTQALRKGINVLAIDVATTWVNRLIAAGRDDPKSAAGQLYAGDAPRRASGLAGPVVLERQCPA